MTGDSRHYDDIIHLPHHTSKKHPRMSLTDRAAQFSPFAALTGYDAVIREEGRFTDTQMDLDENVLERLDERLWFIRENLDSEPMVAITYFQPDERKEGGAYVTVTGSVKKIDEYENAVVLKDGNRISIEQITEIEVLEK